MMYKMKYKDFRFRWEVGVLFPCPQPRQQKLTWSMCKSLFPTSFHTLILFKAMGADEEASLLTGKHRSSSNLEKLRNVFVWIWRFFIMGISFFLIAQVQDPILRQILKLTIPGNKESFQFHSSNGINKSIILSVSKYKKRKKASK